MRSSIDRYLLAAERAASQSAGCRLLIEPDRDLELPRRRPDRVLVRLLRFGNGEVMGQIAGEQLRVCAGVLLGLRQ